MPATLFLAATLAFASPDTTTSPHHYRVFDADGNPSSFEAIVESIASADVLFIGETHDDPVVHYLQRELLERAFTEQNKRGVVLSMEMFSRDAQRTVNEYLADLITESHFRSASSPWVNYESDYRPLVEFSKIHSLPVVAANAPRRYVNRVTRLGPDALYDLPDYVREYLAPLPYAGASDAYRAEWDALMEESMAEMRATADSMAAADEDEADMPAMTDSTGDAMMPPGHPQSDEVADGLPEGHPRRDDNDMELPEGHPRPEAEETPETAMPADAAHGGMEFMLDAQSLWDATMAWSVAEALDRNPGSLVIHVVGAFHVEHGTGIPEHLNRYRPGVKRVIVSVRPADDIGAFDRDEHGGLGDFIILADASLPRTHVR